MIVIKQKSFNQLGEWAGVIIYGDEDYCKFEIDENEGTFFLKLRGVMGAMPRRLDSIEEVIVDGTTVYKRQGD